MDREGFVEAVRRVVLDSAVTSTISQLSKPAGRKPDQARLDLSAWLNGLPHSDRQKLEHIIKMTANTAVFGMLCVLDGVRAIEDGPGKGAIDLRYRRGEDDISLTDDSGEQLHDLL